MTLGNKTTLILATLVMGSSVMAQTKAPEPDYTMAYNVGATSDYRFRGISQTSFKPAVQAGADFAHKSGIYVGVWGSNVNWLKDFSGATEDTKAR